jgi:hypothetical protein
MTTIAIIPDDRGTSPTTFRAVAGDVQSVGATVGQALDALTAQLGEPLETMLIVVHPLRPDTFFTAAQQQRLAELPAQEQAELDALVEAELRAASQRSAALARQLPS